MKVRLIDGLICLMILAVHNIIYAQPAYPSSPIAPASLSNAEYYFGPTDPGFGNGNPISLSPAVDVPGFLATLDISSLPPGVHLVNIRTQDVFGHWSHTHVGTFENLMPAYPSSPTSPAVVDQIEYFFNSDPGFGFGQTIPVTTSMDITDLVATVDLSGISPGIHQLFIRSHDANGEWSITCRALFSNIIHPYPPAPVLPTQVTAMEYFVDTDPGFGNGNSLNSFIPGIDLSNIIDQVDITGTSPGNHLIFFRTRDLTGSWSITNHAAFENSLFIYPTPPTTGPITQIEYFFDTDPGHGNGQILLINPTTDLSDSVITLDITGLSAGIHPFFVRTYSNEGWSLTAGSDISALLPVNLMNFDYKLESSGVRLIWETASEQNNDYFLIEKARKKDTFKELTTVPGNGTTSTLSSYSHFDPYIGQGTTFYRLTQVDYDGTSKELGTIAVNNTDGTLDNWLIFPVPTHDHLTLQHPGKIIRRLEIRDSAGRLLILVPAPVSDLDQLQINTETLPPGIYHGIMDTGADAYHFSFIKSQVR